VQISKIIQALEQIADFKTVRKADCKRTQQLKICLEIANIELICKAEFKPTSQS